MIADKVEVLTRSYRDEQSWRWESDGTGTYRIEPTTETLPRGTRVILHLREDQLELADEGRIREIIKRYSSFVPHPIQVGDARVNDQRPIWVEPKSQVTDEQYTQFYQHLTHRSGEEPLWHLHRSVDSPLQFHALIYCPPTNLERLGLGRNEHGLNLCAKRVLVQSDCREILPEYLRFLYGLVDSEDLPLSVSRESLMDDSAFRKIRSALVKAILDRMDKLSTEDSEKYQTFIDQFGIILREGIHMDPAQRERIAKLLRFASSHTVETGETSTGLDAYIERAGETETQKIYIAIGPDQETIAKSPNLEVFRKRNLEVLYLTDPVDEYVLTMLHRYKDFEITPVDAADIALAEDEPKLEGADQDNQDAPASGSGFEKVLRLFQEALGEKISEVRASKRLVDSPCCLVHGEGGFSVQMQKLLKMANQEVPEPQRILEINPSAPLIKRLSLLASGDAHDPFIRDCGVQLWSNAMVLEGLLPDPQQHVSRVQTMMAELAEKRSPILH